MPIKIYWIHRFSSNGQLGIMARPRGGDWLADEIESLKNSNVDILLCLLEYHEIIDLELTEEANICSNKNIKYIHYAIPDRSIPENNYSAVDLVRSLSTKIKEGQSVVIHCRMGIGRSSIIAGAILKLFDFKTADILAQIKTARGLNIPDTEEQINWLKNFGAQR